MRLACFPDFWRKHEAKIFLLASEKLSIVCFIPFFGALWLKTENMD
jgi:hypothetical protein